MSAVISGVIRKHDSGPVILCRVIAITIIHNINKFATTTSMARGYAYAKTEYVSVYVRIFRNTEYAYDTFRRLT